MYIELVRNRGNIVMTSKSKPIRPNGRARTERGTTNSNKSQAFTQWFLRLKSRVNFEVMSRLQREIQKKNSGKKFKLTNRCLWQFSHQRQYHNHDSATIFTGFDPL